MFHHSGKKEVFYKDNVHASDFIAMMPCFLSEMPCREILMTTTIEKACKISLTGFM